MIHECDVYDTADNNCFYCESESGSMDGSMSQVNDLPILLPKMGRRPKNRYYLREFIPQPHLFGSDVLLLFYEGFLQA